MHKIILIASVVGSLLYPIGSDAIIHANTHYAAPRIEPGAVLNDFEKQILIDNVLNAMKYADIAAIRANIGAGFNPFKTNDDGYSYMDAFISLSQNIDNKFGAELSVLVNELIDYSRRNVYRLVRAANENDTELFQSIVNKQDFYYYTPIDTSHLIGHTVVKLGCDECLEILESYNYNLSIPAPDGSRIK